MPEVADIQHPVILFDGVCNLCNSVVLFIIKRDKKNRFRFASLQSSFGQRLLEKYSLPRSAFNSFILFTSDKIFTKSTGALMVAKHLSGGWSLLYSFIIIPSFIRDLIYDFIAKNRYRWFGKKDSCMIPSPELRIRFLD